jgi:hypothetical protein
LETGQTQTVVHVAARFASVWERLRALAEAADLPNRARERLAKAERLTVQWLATLTFFFATVTAKVEALALPPPLETAVLEQLVPALYLERAAARSANTETRHRGRAMSTRLLDPLRQPAHPLQTLEPGLLAQVEQVAGTCADLFQRSSSCVEGRNGQLSLHHHGRHRLSDRKLAALTAVHNFHLRRTTARPPPNASSVTRPNSCSSKRSSACPCHRDRGEGDPVRQRPAISCQPQLECGGQDYEQGPSRSGSSRSVCNLGSVFC